MDPVTNAMYELVADVHIPSMGACVEPVAEAMRVFTNFRYRVFNDGEDNFGNNCRTKELAKVDLPANAPPALRDFFDEARTFDHTKYWNLMNMMDDFDEQSIKMSISLDRLDDIMNVMVPWVYFHFFPPASPDEILQCWKIVEVEQKARRVAEHASWEAEQAKKYLEEERIAAVNTAKKVAKAAKIDAKKVAKAAANAKRRERANKKSLIVA